MPIRIVATSPTRKRQGRRGQFGGAKKYVPDVAKSAQHPHSKLKTQKELKKITDSAEYKKGDYKKQTEMLGGKTWTAQEMQTKIKNRPKPKKIKIESNMESRSKNWPFAKGGRIGLRTGSRGPSAGQRIKARKSREREWWTSRGGPEGTKGDTTGHHIPSLDKKLREKRPHSSPEGRDIDVKAAFAKADKDRKRRVLPKPPRGWNRPARLTTGEKLRAKHGLGSLVRKVITKIKPKPKPKPGAVKDVNVDKLLKNLGDEIKAAPLPPQLKKSLDKLKKAYPHKKARGGRIGLQHGSRPRPSGPHTWVRSGGAVLKGKKVGIQIK